MPVRGVDDRNQNDLLVAQCGLCIQLKSKHSSKGLDGHMYQHRETYICCTNDFDLINNSRFSISYTNIKGFRRIQAYRTFHVNKLE